MYESTAAQVFPVTRDFYFFSYIVVCLVNVFFCRLRQTQTNDRHERPTTTTTTTTIDKAGLNFLPRWKASVAVQRSNWFIFFSYIVVGFSNSSFYVCMFPWCFQVSILVSRESTRLLFFQLQVFFVWRLYSFVCMSQLLHKFFRWQEIFIFSVTLLFV